MLSQGHEAKSDNLQHKLQAARDYAINICIFGANNKIADIEKTNGWGFFPKYRYHTTGRYLKYSDGGFNSSIPGENFNNIFFDSENNQLAVKVKNTSYSHRPASDITWYYHCEDSINADKLSVYFSTLRQNENPLFDPQFALSSFHINLLAGSLLTIDKRQGNCGERAYLVSKYLWEHSAGINRIEVIAMTTLDHTFVIVNRSGNLQDPSTWGNAWIIDAWYQNKGCIFPACEFPDQIKKIEQFVKDQAKKLNAAGISTVNRSDLSGNLYKCDIEIEPDKNRYPSYFNRPIDDFYIVLNAYRGIYPGVDPNSSDSIFSSFQKDKESHQAKFKVCLKEIEEFDNKKQNPKKLTSSTANNAALDQANTPSPSLPPEKSFFAEVMEYRQRLFDDQKKCCLGFFRKTKVTVDFTPQNLLMHALGKRNRSNQVLRFFGIIKKDGTVDPAKEEAFLKSGTHWEKPIIP